MTEFKSPYKQQDRKVNTWCNYTKRLDTYGCGCQHDCDYCYAKSLLGFRGLWNAVEPSCASMNVIRESIYNLNRSDVIRLGVMTDCFQPIEAQKMITYNTIKLLNNHKINYLIVTKSDMVANDKYLDIYDRDLAHFQITVTSTSSNKYEKAPHPLQRIKAIEKLQSLGFDVSLRLSPFIPENIDLNIINNIKCSKILVEFLKVSHNIEKCFNIDYSNYTLKHRGYKHLQLDQQLGFINNITGFDQLSVGASTYDHYLYYRDNVNYNKKDCCNLSLKYFPEPQLKLSI